MYRKYTWYLIWMQKTSSVLEGKKHICVIILLSRALHKTKYIQIFLIILFPKIYSLELQSVYWMMAYLWKTRTINDTNRESLLEG